MSVTADTKTNLLVIGATGYIGGSVLARFLDRPDAHSLNFTALVRSPSKAQKLKKFGINAILGSFDDGNGNGTVLLEDLAAESDIVLSLADADHLGAVKAILNGLQRRNRETGQIPILIHTSGAGVVADNAAGAYESDTIYYDNDPSQLESLPETQFHRNVELEIIDADKNGYVRTYIVSPGLIYGIASTKFTTEGGLQNPYSLQIPYLIDAALDRGWLAGMVGEGKNVWPMVHIHDVAEIYSVLYDSIITKPSTIGHGREGTYFVENGESTLYSIAHAIGEALRTLGKVVSVEPTMFTQEEINKYFNGYTFFGSNCRCRGMRSREIGWSPRYTMQDMVESVRLDVEAALSGRGPIALAFHKTIPLN